MGRRKLEMKKIENLDARRVCFTKRRQGLFKKAAKLSKDHNLNILSIVFSPAGKPFVFSSGGNPSISFDSMLENFNFLLNGSSSSSSSSSHHHVAENDFEQHCSTSVDEEATIDLEGTLNAEEEEEEQTRVYSIEGISDSSFQFGDEIQQPLSDFEIENPNLLCPGDFEEQTPIDLEGIWDSSFQFGEIIKPLSDFEIENPNFVETDGLTLLDVEDYSMEEIRSPVLLGAEDNYGFTTTDLSQIQFGEEEYEFDPLLLDTNNLYDNYDATAAIFEELFQ